MEDIRGEDMADLCITTTAALWHYSNGAGDGGRKYQIYKTNCYLGGSLAVCVPATLHHFPKLPQHFTFALHLFYMSWKLQCTLSTDSNYGIFN